MYKRLIFFVIMIVLAATACNNSDNHQTSASPEVAPIAVTTYTVGKQDMQRKSLLSGTVQSADQSVISAKMMGYVQKLNVEIGQQVHTGQTILTIENNELPAKKAQIQAGINEAKAGLANVKLNYDRFKQLWEQQSITKKEWDDISSQYTMMQAKVESAEMMKKEIESMMQNTVVKAPISGTITSKNINAGDLVNPGVPLMTIDGQSGYEVMFYVSDDFIDQMEAGMSIEVQLKNDPAKLTAIVTEVAPSAVHTGGQFGVKAKIRAEKTQMKAIHAGEYASVLVDFKIDNKDKSIISLPKSVVINRGQLTGVYTVGMQNKALLRWIRIGKDLGNEVEVVSGIREGEKVITGPLASLFDGAPVRLQ